MHRRSFVSPGYRVAQAALVVMLVAIPAGVYLYHHRPNLYDRARTDLLQARRELDIYHHDMEMLVDDDRDSAKALKASISWLQKAAVFDPSDLAAIKAITSGLQQWEEQARTGTLSAGELHDRYRSLDAQVQRLIRKRTKAARNG